jgi:thymidylate synthase
MACYWMWEQSGVLKPAIAAYLRGEPLERDQIGALRAYFRQWIEDPRFIGEGVDQLRAMINGLTNRKAIRDWLDLATEEGVDPL